MAFKKLKICIKNLAAFYSDFSALRASYSCCINFCDLANKFGKSSLVKPLQSITGRIDIMLWPDDCKNVHYFYCFRLFFFLVLPLPQTFALWLRNVYRDTTTGWTKDWLWMAMWNGPFLKGNNCSPPCLVPSGNISSLAFRWLMASDSLFSVSSVSRWLDRFM